MSRRTLSAAAWLLLASAAAPVMALGVGPITNQTALGQTLQFGVGVRLDGDEDLRSDCVAVEAWSGDARVPPSTLRWTVEPGAGASDRTLRVVSSMAIDEPVVTLNVHFNCSTTRLTREFVLLVDPPTVTLAQTASAAPTAATATAIPAPLSAAPPAAPARVAQSTPAAAPAPRARKTPAPKPAAARSVAPTTAEVREAAAPPASRQTAAARPATAPATGSRLKLEAAGNVAARTRTPAPAAAAPAEAAPPALPASAASAPEDPAVQQARERLQALEASLAKLAQESRATQAGVAELQAQLREAQEQRYANGLVYALGTLAALLSVALAVVLWRRPPAPVADGQWWASGLQREDASVTGAGVGPAPAGDSSAMPLVETTASPMLLQQIPAVAAETPATGRRPAPPDPEMTVEELIDLEQQAEFFVVLGQDEAAIELLTGHLDSVGAASPLPYLKLLEIHRRRGDREASERIRERFNRRFNAYAPEWQADPLQGRSLVDYPAVLSNLQRLWSTPARAMRALEASLFRRDGVDSTFDLPAYRELLFLYALARDLSERESTAPSVDLLLPLAAEASQGHAAAAASRVDAPTRVDVDITRLQPGSGDDSSRDAGPSSFATPLELGVPGTRR